MDYIVLTGVKPYDGRYPLDLTTAGFTTREWGWIKRHSGYLPLTIAEGFQGGDAELFAVFAVIALRRAGKIEQNEVPRLVERIGDADYNTAISFESDTVDEEADADPPPRSFDGSPSSSGSDGRTSSETSPTIPPAGGHPASDSSEYSLIRSGS